MKISATRLKTYHKCGKQYYYKYVRQLPDIKNKHAILGSAVHQGIASGFEGHDPVLTFQYSWKALLEEHKVEHDAVLFNRGLKMVADFPYYTFGFPLAVEQEYSFMYPENEPFAQITVVFDQMYDWGVLDLKTNKRKPQKLLLDNDIQFILYAEAFRIINGYVPEKMIWYHLETQEPIIADVQNKRFIAEEAIESLRFAISTDSYFRRISFECSWCPFSEVCFSGLQDGEKSSETDTGLDIGSDTNSHITTETISSLLEDDFD